MTKIYYLRSIVIHVTGKGLSGNMSRPIRVVARCHGIRTRARVPDQVTLIIKAETLLCTSQDNPIEVPIFKGETGHAK